MSLDKLNKKHASYTENQHRYNFLYRSYVGGEYYRKGSYLHKYWGEDAAPFDAYARRLDATPLDNHVRTTVDIYRSYIWKTPPVRDFNTAENNPFVESFLNNADRQGQTLDSWLKNALDWAMVLGNVWVLVDKPTDPAETAADEIANDLRAYVTMYTPQNVMDWEYGSNNKLEFIKTIEKYDSEQAVIKCWYPEVVIAYTVSISEATGEFDAVISEEATPNNLGRIPIFELNPNPLPGKRGVAASILGDVADTQRSIYNKLSELEQTIRLASHPSLVKTGDAKASAGAGAIITIQEDMEPGLRPYLLQPTGASVDGILKAIEHDVTSINSMTHLTAVRAQKGAQSGVAIQTERQLLNAKLGDLSDTIREAENKIWTLWMDWMDLNAEVDVAYSTHYDTRDPNTYMDTLIKSLEVVDDPAYIAWVKEEIVSLMVVDQADSDRIIVTLAEDINNNTDSESTPDSE